MQKRVLTGVIAILIFLPVLFYSNTIIFPITLAFLAGVAVYEFAKCVGFSGKVLYVEFPVILIAAALPIFARYKPEWLGIAGLLVFIYLLFLMVLGFGKIDIPAATTMLFGFIYTSVALALLVLVRDMAPARYALIFIAAWSTDTFAYFGGFLLGKRKLCPRLSPKKTIAGAISGIIGAVFCFTVFGLVIVSAGGSFPFLKYCLIAIPASIASQLGDLSASAIKRHYGIKDYGNIFPGHGGVLDRFDSILPLSIGAYIILSII
ncbi:MAG: hypothetical protein A2Y15_07270 [Clostridiales bacterium GWF2_36_10]|nr:MAG: hypothetical protein A2Y15_07270 [Clostridiales bacterium GWF2_36_10]HAN21314.1 hypothetical protein [Clostridiales bacterium]